jgi:hypothetical protein
VTMDLLGLLHHCVDKRRKMRPESFTCAVGCPQPLPLANAVVEERLCSFHGQSSVSPALTRLFFTASNIDPAANIPCTIGVVGLWMVVIMPLAHGGRVADEWTVTQRAGGHSVSCPTCKSNIGGKQVVLPLKVSDERLPDTRRCLLASMCTLQRVRACSAPD